MRNNNLRTKLEYFREDYNEEREMKPRPRPARAVTPPLRAVSPRVCRRMERVVEFEETQNKGESRVERNIKGGRPSEEAPRGNGSQNVNLPPFLAAHIGRSKNRQPLRSFLIFVYEGQALPNNVGVNIPLNGNPSIRESFANLPRGGHVSLTFINAYVYVPKHACVCQPKHNSLFLNPLGSVTPFIRWIEDYPLPDGLKMPSYIGSYDGKGDPDNFMHLFEGAIRMQKWTRSLVEHLSTDLPLTYKGLMKKTYTWSKQERWPLMASQVIKEIVLKDQRNPPGTTTEDRKTKTGSPPIKDQTTACSPICLKVQEKFLPHKELKKASNHLQDVRKQTITRYLQVLEDYAAKKIVSESMAYKEGITFPPVTRVSNAPVIIEAVVFERKVGRVYMDSGSTCEVIYEHCFEKLNPTIKATRVNTKIPLVGFSRKRSWSVGEVPLEITIGEHPLSRIEILNFVIVKSDSPHNMLLGRTAMQKMGIVVLIIYGAIKFHTKKEVRIVLSVGEAGEETKKARRTLTISKERIPSCDDTENDKHLPMDTCRHDGNSENHHGLDRNASACKEAEELTKAGIIRKVKHQTWVAKPVMVKKNDGGWRMCVDSTNINKAYLKDCYPLPQIDWKIESLVEFSLKCFMYAYKGCHQIYMAEEDEDKTAFFVGEGVFGYEKMPVGLKNARATYQRLVVKFFSKQIRRNLEAYVDDMVKQNQEKDKIGSKQEASSSKLSRDQTSNPTSSTNPTPKGQIRRSSKQKVKNSNFEEHFTPVATMTDNHTMAEMLRAPTEGCAEAIVVPPILAE
nr:hypothetical protein [Tanacetum cinerariifolium]GEX00487.1 hypothetical protein [Tanacetum cinerariifolium]